MLNFTFLKPQINSMIEEKKGLEEKFLKKINLAHAELKAKSGSWEELSQKVKLSKTSWLLPEITSSLNATYPLPPRPAGYTVLSSDGSQIFPDRHEVLPCFLINIGSVFLKYGDDSKASLSSYPKFFYKDEDRLVTWNGRKIPADAAVISEKRNLMEFEELLKLVEKCKSTENTIALSDGTLILWRLEAFPDDLREEIVAQFNRLMEELKKLRIPVAGYISHPGSADIINALRVGLCPEKISYCKDCPYTELPELPCEPIEGLTDRILFSGTLDLGERTALFKSSSRVLELYGAHHVYFFYVNVGEEIVRIEVPEWVAKDEALLNLVHTLIFDQAKKGNGYPVALREAHESAVVRGKDRDFFFELIRDMLIKSDFKIMFSRKGLSKRSPEI